MRLDIDLSRVGPEVRVCARGSRGEQVTPRPLGGGFDVDAIQQMAIGIRRAAEQGRPLSAPLLAKAQALESALLGADIERLKARLTEAARGPLLIRFALHDPELQAVPWEALCKPGESMGFWASSPDVLPVRGVTSDEPWQPRSVRGAVRVLAIAPAGGEGLAVLRSALAARIEDGEIEWLDPVEGSAARVPGLFIGSAASLSRTCSIFSAMGLWRMASPSSGWRIMMMAKRAGCRSKLLAQQLKSSLRGFLRLIVLECCEGARPGALASAAEILGRAGADAVVAHLWPVKADVARICSSQLYRAIAGKDQSAGNVALGINEARRAILGAFEGSAEAFSPVVYLRGPDGVLFDFDGRKLAPPSPSVSVRSSRSRVDPALASLVARPFSLLLGDRFMEQSADLAGFRDRLQKDLAKSSVITGAALPMSALAQRFALHRGPSKLGAEFQKAFRSGAPKPPFLESLSRLVGPGVHTTLPRFPWLEHAIAEQQPERTIYVIQPGEEGMMILRRPAHSDDWEELGAPPASIDPDEDTILLRSYGGYTPEQIFARPLLTEDDYVFGVRELERDLPPDLANALLSALCYRPALIVGLGLYNSHHRILLHRIYPWGMPRGSVAVIDPSDDERSLWEKGAGLPGKGEGISVIVSSAEDLCAQLSLVRGSL